MLASDDILAIHHLIAEYSHVIDGRRWDELPDIFTEDGVFDAAAAGYVAVKGQTALRAHMETANHPMAHYVTNTVVRPVDRDTAEAVSMIIAPWPDGDVSFGGTYHDRIVRTASGWRIQTRTVIPGKGYEPR